MLFSSSVSCLGWSVLDEISLIFVSFALLFLMTRGVHIKKEKNEDYLIKFFYFFLIFIFFATSVSGIFFWGEIKAIRFSLLFLAVFIFSWNLFFYEWNFPKKIKIFSILLKVGFFYYSLIILLGFIQILINPSFIFAMFRGLGGASSMGALFPGIVLIPIGFYVLNSSIYKPNLKLLAFLNLFLFFICTLLMDARAGYLIIFLSLLMLPFAEGIFRTIFIFLGSLFIIVLTSTIFLQHPLWILDAIESSLGAFSIESGTTVHQYYDQDYIDAKGDIGRYMYSYCAIKTVLQNPQTYLIGVGSYGFFENLNPCLEAFKIEYSLPDYTRNTAVGGGLPRPPALGAWLIENGLIAVFFLILSLLSTIFKSFLVMKGRKFALHSKKALHFLPMIIILPGWAYFAEFQDSIFFYIIFMPFGFLYLLTKIEPNKEI